MILMIHDTYMISYMILILYMIPTATPEQSCPALYSNSQVRRSPVLVQYTNHLGEGVK